MLNRFPPDENEWQITSLHLKVIDGLASALFTGAGFAPANNTSLYYPFVLDKPFTFDQAWVMNGSAAGNFDIGVYDALTLGKIISTGSTAMSGTSIQKVSLAKTKLAPGGYYLAFGCSTTGAQFARMDLNAGTAVLNARGFRQESTFPLPATATPVVTTTNRINWFGIRKSIV